MAMPGSSLTIFRYVLDTIVSLDGGKPASMTLRSPPQRIRSLLAQEARISSDLRLFAQVELNTLRTNVHDSIVSAEGNRAIDADESVSRVVQGTFMQTSST